MEKQCYGVMVIPVQFATLDKQQAERMAGASEPVTLSPATERRIAQIVRQQMKVSPHVAFTVYAPIGSGAVARAVKGIKQAVEERDGMEWVEVDQDA